MSNLAACVGSACVDDLNAAILIGIPLVCYALGYGIGQAVLWVRRLSEVV